MFKKTNSVLAVLSYALLMWCCGSLGFNVQHRSLWLFVAAVVASLVLTWQFVRAVKESHRGTPSLSHAFMSNPFFDVVALVLLPVYMLEFLGSGWLLFFALLMLWLLVDVVRHLVNRFCERFPR